MPVLRLDYINKSTSKEISSQLFLLKEGISGVGVLKFECILYANTIYILLLGNLLFNNLYRSSTSLGGGNFYKIRTCCCTMQVYLVGAIKVAFLYLLP